VTHVKVDGTPRSIRTIKRSEINAFKGSVWEYPTGKGWNNVGWARIYFRNNGPDPIFEGTYSVQDVIQDIRLRVAGIEHACELGLTFGGLGKDVHGGLFAFRIISSASSISTLK
jgi:hypothetical protein